MADNIINTLGVDQNIQAPVEEGAGLSQEQMRANLQEMAGNIESKYQDFNSQKFASKNKLELKKREALKEVFDIMETAGIDLNSPEDVKMFLDSLREKNPELSQIIESSLEELFSEDSSEQIPPVSAQQMV